MADIPVSKKALKWAERVMVWARAPGGVPSFERPTNNDVLELCDGSMGVDQLLRAVHSSSWEGCNAVNHSSLQPGHGG
jgi:hypothetical protein